MNELELLRMYEPIVRYTMGEIFFPMPVDEYARNCSLWTTEASGEEKLLVPEGELELDMLAKFDQVPPGHTLHLRFIAEPMIGLRYRLWARGLQRENFQASGRMTRVPLLFRIFDSLLDLSLAVRGMVPGSIAAAADYKYQKILEREPRHVYYGRVVREAGWTVLQYLFFFPMNNWRSRFFGANDHEADWEQMFIYLYENEEGQLTPHWVAYASHDFKGDDLRRRWDDPLLVRDGEHPVVFVGAGSHASYFKQGEYMMGASPKFLNPVVRVMDALRNLWTETLGMGEVPAVDKRLRQLIRVPFIDYARGDGRVIGPGQHEEWSPELISDAVGWVSNYRGLWGLDTRDPVGGERAPAGPKYNRDGSVRQSWHNPLGWAGLDKIYPPNRVGGVLKRRIAHLNRELKDLQIRREALREEVRGLALDEDALKTIGHYSSLHEMKVSELASKQMDLQAVHSRAAELAETRLALQSSLERAKRGEWGPPEAHIQGAHLPEPSLPPRSRLVEVWAAISGALILLPIVGLLVFRPSNWPLWLLGIAFTIAAIEAVASRRLANFLITSSIALAILASMILILEFWEAVVIAAVVGVVVFMIRDNLRELSRS